MSIMRENYWPTDFGVDTEITPLTVLKEQAANLGQMTKNLVEGVVQTRPEVNAEFRHSLYLSVPTLANYRYFLLSVTEEPKGYPVRIFDGTSDTSYEVQDLDEFRERLKEILSSDRVRKLVRNLLRYASTGYKF